MKRIITLIVLLATTYAFSQPANDVCSGAISLGTLPQPGNCGSGIQTGTVVTLNTTNVAATTENPYFAAGCITGTNDTPNSVWYSFVAPTNGYGVTISVTNGGAALANPSISLMSGACGTLTGYNCATGAGGTVSLTQDNQLVPGQTYYIMIGGNNGQSGTFTLNVNALQDCSDCLRSGSLTVSPQPTNGSYPPGTNVQFCYHVDQWVQIANNWLHGVQMVFGAGWDPSTIVATPPTNDYFYAGSHWDYYPTGVTEGNGTNWPAGFYFDDDNDGDPTNNFGDGTTNSGGVYTPPANEWSFCWTISTDDICIPGQSLDVDIYTSGDGESGSWLSVGCADDPVVSFSAITGCCPPTFSTTSACAGQTTGSITSTLVGGTVGPVSYLWSPGGQTTPNLTNIGPGTYTLQITDGNNCQVTGTTTLLAFPLPTVNAGPDVIICAGQSTTFAGTASSSDMTPVTFNNNTSVAIPDNGINDNGAGWNGVGGGATSTIATTGINSGWTFESVTFNITHSWDSDLVIYLQNPCGGLIRLVRGEGGSGDNFTNTTFSQSATANITTGTPPFTGTWIPEGGAGLWAAFLACTTGNGNWSLVVGDDVGGDTGSITSWSLVLNNPSTPSFTWSPTTAMTGSTTLTPTVTPASTTTYTLSATSANGCTATDQVTVTVNPLATANAGPDQSLCAGGTVTLAGSIGGSATSGTWTAPSGTFSSATNLGATYTPSITSGTVTLTLTTDDPAGTCIAATDQIVITVNPIPTVSAGAPVSVCQGTPVTLTGSGTAFVYTWDNGVTNGVAFTPTATTTYTVTGTSAPGCIATSTVTVTVNPIPVVVANDVSVCAGGTVTVSASGATTYSWSPSTYLSASTGSSVTFTAGATTSYTVTGTGAGGCTSTDPVTVTVTPNAPISAGPDVTICSGLSTTLTASGGSTYNWTSPALGTNPSQTVSPTSTTTYTVVGTDAAGCTGTDAVTVTVSPLPTVNAVTNQTLCANLSTTGITFSGAVAGTTYNWTNTNASIGLAASGSGNISSFTAINTGSTAQTATITVTPTAGGCTGTPINFTITVNPIPTVNPTADQSLCANTAITAVTFTGSVAGTTYNWTNSNTSIGLAGSGSGNIASVTGTNSTGSPITGTITVTPVAGTCTGTPDVFDITINPIPTVNDPADQAICANAMTTAVNFTGNSGSTIYNWTNTNASIGLAASGSGNIASFSAVNTGATALTATITVTPTLGSCTGTPQTFTITVNPIPTVTDPADQTLCANTMTTAVTFTGNSGSTVYNWTNSNTTIGLAASGSGNISSFSATNTGGTAQVSTITVTPTLGTCTGTPQTFTITVNPVPTVTDPADQALCANTMTTAVNFTGNSGSSTYSWTNTNTTTGLAASGSGNIAPFSAINTGATAQVSTVTVTPTLGTCVGTPQTFTITVNPIPTVTDPADQLLCANSMTTAVNFTGNSGSSVYNWTNSNTSIGLAASGSGNIASFNAMNTGATALTSTVTVTPTLGTCVGTPQSFTITVNPLPTALISGTSSVCQNGVNPTITLTGSNGTAPYTFTYNINGGANQTITSAGTTATISVPSTTLGTFTYNLVSVSDASSTACSQTQSGSATVTVNPNPSPVIVGATTYCTGSSASVSTSVPFNTYLWSPTGATTQNTTMVQSNNPITVTVTNGFGCSGTSPVFTVTENSVINYDTQVEICQGQSALIHGVNRTVAGVYSQTFVLPTGCDSVSNVTLIVHALPTINAGPDQTVCSGDQVLVNATGAPTITWNPVTTNGTYITPAVGTVTYTATGTDVNGCQNTDAFNITVNPVPTVNPVANATYCNGVATTAINFTGSVGGATYSWTNTAPSIGIAASGSGNIGSFAATNTGSSPVVATITVTPSAAGCTGTPINFTITVNPTPTIGAISDQTWCANASTDAVNMTGTVAGTTFNWTNSNSSIGLTASGSGNIASFTAVNAGTTAQTANVLVTPTANGCTGTAEPFSFTINPIPVIVPSVDQTRCEGSLTNPVNFSSGVVGTTYSWTNNNGGIGLATSGSGNISAFTTTNSGNSTITGTITVTPTANTCVGTPDMFDIVVNPTPDVNPIGDQIVCAGQTVTAINISGSVAGTVYTWSNNNSTVGLASSGSGSIASFTGTNTTSVNQVATVVVTPTANSCVGATETFTITVKPIPTVNISPDQTICAQSQTNAVNFNSAVVGTNFNWTNNNPAIGLGASGSGSISAFTGVNNGAVPVQGTITVTPIANGCTGTSDAFNITVNPLPTAVIAGTADRCINGTQPAITFTGSNGTAPYTFNYTLNGSPATIVSVGNTATLNAPTSVAGTFTYALVSVTDASSTACSQAASGSATVTVHALPAVAIVPGDFDICDNETVTLTGSGASTYSWSPALTNGVAFEPPLGTTTYTVTGTDAFGCVNQAQVDVTVNPLPVVNAGPDQAVCEGTAVTLSGSGAATYTWNNSVTNGVPFIPSSTQTYTVTGTSAAGCTGMDQVIVVVNPIPVVNAGNNISLCEGQSVTLTGSGANTYTWNNNVVNGVSFTPGVGSATYTVTGTTTAGCTDTDQLTVTVNPLPQVNFTPDVTIGCAPLTVIFTNNTPNATNCIWTMSDGSTFTGCGTVTNTFENPGCYDVSLTTTDVNGCTNSASATNLICVEAVPNASFVPSTNIVSEYDPIVNFNNTSTGASDYLWNFGDFSLTSTEVDPSHNYLGNEIGEYVVTLIASTPFGCLDTAYATIIIEEELVFYVPNTFTPDNDKYNPVFQPVFTSGFDPQDYTLYIFNRWGELIFESHNAEIGWDGTYGSRGEIEMCQDGVYTWKIEFKVTKNDERKMAIGHVNLLR